MGDGALSLSYSKSALQITTKGSGKELDTEFTSIKVQISTSNATLVSHSSSARPHCVTLLELQKQLKHGSNTLSAYFTPPRPAGWGTIAHHIKLQTPTLIFNFPFWHLHHFHFRIRHRRMTLGALLSFGPPGLLDHSVWMSVFLHSVGLSVSRLCLRRPKRLCHRSFSPCLQSCPNKLQLPLKCC